MCHVTFGIRVWGDFISLLSDGLFSVMIFMPL